MTSRLKDLKEKGAGLKDRGLRRDKTPSSSSSSSISGMGIRGRVSGLVHRDGGSSSDAPTHQARPITELRDPASFAPPPKRTATGLAPPPPPPSAPVARQVVPAPSKYHDPRSGPLDPRALRNAEPEQPEEDARPRGPYRVDTTGLSTNHLPPPPGRRDGANGRTPPPPSYESATGRPAALPPSTPARSNTSTPASTTSAKPSLPPRLPPRTNSSATATTPVSPESTGSSSHNLLNQSAVNRLGAAGVSVPGLGIGRSDTGPPAPGPGPGPGPPPPPPASRQSTSQVNELQNRFANLKTTSPSQQQQQQQQQQQRPAEGTTWAQKQAALKTASSFQKDPSSVSMSDARAAAGTANNFRQRHGEQVASGMRGANSLNQKYGITNKLGGYAGGGTQQQDQGQAGGGGGATAAAAAATPAAAKKKPPPPPPPKKKPGLGGSPVVVAPASDEPPPIPMATRPTF
ncbi:hypothetical protein ACRE_068280 [Hapsidospora chrysogenum ATCC 11550]|uniref:Uncharacterized protein n=1 Tax=Hapsidospora chrysogenum (strain ATCC 11550 / CBS 779.69 / DSM 880 / IAM 14645 / JCM 23072 / IMI 49137) TaxID=857340 RepID=A0A086SZA7_HAPC1|nr:hypothetical protein ACRE_068280 [Hapsidospora chrysogenum ATCC 11550]